MSVLLSHAQRISTDNTSKVLSYVRREHILVGWIWYADWDALQEFTRLRRFLFFVNMVLVDMMLALILLYWQATSASFKTWYEDDVGHYILVMIVMALICYVVEFFVVRLHVIGQTSSGWFGMHPIKKYIVDFLNLALFITVIAMVIYFSQKVNQASGSSGSSNTKTFMRDFFISQAVTWALMLVLLPILWHLTAYRCRPIMCPSLPGCRQCYGLGVCQYHYQIKCHDGFVRWRA